MKSLINKVLTTSAVISLGGGILNSNHVFAATIGYDLKFFNNSGNEVGLGEFTYDPDTSICIPEIPIDEFCEFGGLSIATELTNFSVNILGTQWKLNDRAGQLWWDEQLSTVKGAFARGGNISISNQWLFGDQVFAGTFLDMDGIEGQSGGIWRQDLNFNNFVEGTWIAELKDTTSPGGHVVPEPLTLLGAGFAIGFGAFFKSKLK